VTNPRSGAGAGIEVRAPKAHAEFRAGDLERSGRDADDVQIRVGAQPRAIMFTVSQLRRETTQCRHLSRTSRRRQLPEGSSSLPQRLARSPTSIAARSTEALSGAHALTVPRIGQL